MVLSCASLSPSLDEGSSRASCRDAPVSGDAFLEKGEQNTLSTLGAALHHPLLCRCSWRLKPQQEALGTHKAPAETGTAPQSPQPMGSSAFASKRILYSVIPAWDAGRKGMGGLG